MFLAKKKKTVDQLYLLGNVAFDMTESAKAEVSKTKQPLERHTGALSQHLGTQVSERCQTKPSQNGHHVV